MNRIVSDLLNLIKKQFSPQRQTLVAIAGIPGSGKSTICRQIKQEMGDQTVGIVSMDGYHIPQQYLSPEEMAVRGAPHTFDYDALEKDLTSLRQNQFGSFPSFDHHVGDPVPNSIVITPNQLVVLIEGNYLLMNVEPWNRLSNLFDVRWFMDVGIDDAMARVIYRHMQAFGLSYEAAEERANRNDRQNASWILKYRSPSIHLYIPNIQDEVFASGKFYKGLHHRFRSNSVSGEAFHAFNPLYVNSELPYTSPNNIQ
ncbi:hypothetical protein PCE1_002607 [Barthelona sp. PCE]